MNSVPLSSFRAVDRRPAISRSALLGGAALLAIAYGAPANAQQAVYLDEGTQVENVELGPDDTRLVIDISRVDQATGVLNLGVNGASGPVVTGHVNDGGGTHQAWLQATSTRTVNVIPTRQASSSTTRQYVSADGVQFTGGTVYEASGNQTVLTLGNPNPGGPAMPLRDGPLLLAGDGTVNISLGLIVDDQPHATQSAIRVLEGSSSQARGQGGDGKLDVVISGYIQGDANTGEALVDVQNASSVRLAKGGTLRNTDGPALYAGQADVTIDDDTLIWVSYGTETNGAGGIGVYASGQVVNNGEIRATNGLGGGRASNATGVLLLNGGVLYNKTIQGGLAEINGGRYGVYLYAGDNQVFNEGLITSENGAGIIAEEGTAVVRNGVSGTLRGNTLNSSKVAYTGGDASLDFLVNSGVIDGSVKLGDSDDYFLYTGATNGVTGTIDGGTGSFDAYGRSFSGTANNQLSNAILNAGNNTGFEAHGIEARGTGTVVTAKASETLTNGLALVGDGTVINEADITADMGLSATRVANVPGGLNVVNRGRITAVDYGFRGGTDFASFSNEATGRIVSQGYAVHLGEAYDGDRTRPMSFTNAGWLESTTYVSAVFANVASADDSVASSFVNTGTIRQSGPGQDPTESNGDAALYVYGGLNKGLLQFSNSGFVESTGLGGIGAVFDAGNMELTNTKLIDASGAGGMGLYVNAAGTPDMYARVLNGGTIRANGGGFSDGNGEHVLAAALGVRVGGTGRTVDVTNNDVIEALGASSTAVLVNGRQGEAATQTFNFVNNHNIHGAADTVFAVGEEFADRNVDLAESDLGNDSIERTIAGAIQTVGTTDNIRNNNLISGNVDLADGDDRFEHYGSMQGDVRMGSGNDAFVLGTGSLGDGKRVLGGLGDDTIFVDMNVTADRKIDAAQYKGFERLNRLAGTAGDAKLFVNGVFDGPTLHLNDLTVHIAVGDRVTVATGGVAFTGGDAVERIVNAGTVQGSIKFGGGNDVFENSGTVDPYQTSYVGMGAGDDRVVNSGDIGMGLAGEDGDDVITNSGHVHYADLGTGDDAFTNLTGGEIGHVYGDEGNDTVVNAGLITGNVDLGAGDDRYEAIGSGKVLGAIIGGDGNDTFVFRLAGATGSIPGDVDEFESFAAYGPGTLQMALTRKFDTLEILDGANLDLTNTANWTVGLIKGDDSAQTVTLDSGFTGSVKLYGGADTLEMSLGGELTGDLDGGDDAQHSIDTLKLNLTANSTINNLFGFEAVQVTGASSLTLAGTLGAGQKITFDGGDNEFIIAENAVFQGQADGGAGTDTLRIDTGAASSRTIVSGQLTGFDDVYATGAGTLAFDGGSYNFTAFDATSGNVSVGGGATLVAGGISFASSTDNRFTLEFGSTVGGLVDGGVGGRDVLAFVQAAGEIQDLGAVQASNFEVLAASGAGELHINRDATFDTVQLEGGNIKLLDADLTANVIGGAGNDTFDNGGRVIGSILLGDGDDTYVARTGSSVTGSIDGGVGGNDTVVYSLNDGAGSLLENVINFESIGVYGPGTLNLNLAEDFNSIKLMDGANLTLTDNGGKVVEILGDNSAQTVTIGSALVGGVKLGGGDDTLNLTLGGVLSGALDGGLGQHDTLNLALTAVSTINGMTGFEIANISGAHALTLAGKLGADQRINFDGSDNELIVAAGAVFEGTVDGGTGQNLLRVQSGGSDSRTVLASQILRFQDLVSEGSGTLALTGGEYRFDSVGIVGGSLELGANTNLISAAGVVFDEADNRLTLGSGASIVGRVDAGIGADTLALTQAQANQRLYGSLNVSGFERLETAGAGELVFNVDAAFVNGVGLNGGTTTVNGNATLTARVNGSDSAETFAMLGVVHGDVDLGGGDDRLVVGGASGSGLRSGGAGSNTLDFRTNGVYAAPTIYNASLYQNFDQLIVSGGVVSMTSDSSWKSLSITGGRLIGQAGTVLTSESTIQVAHGAVFGSAGTVNADINVAGTLSPGASPGTMTVNGDVNFATGSNLLLEVSPTASDLLHVTGGLTIASGASIDITGVLTNTPGAVLDLVVADGGITGRFNTINKSSSIFGFVAQNGKKLQIRGEFQNDAAYSGNVRASIAYANQVLSLGQAVQAFTAAVPVLVDANGVSNAKAFGQLTPEAYGSAVQIGTQTALSLIDSTRGFRFDAPEQPGLYGFAQALSGRGELGGNARTGAAGAEMDSQGVITGLGYALESGLRAGAFVGQVETDQTLSGLGASTEAEGFVVGAFADMALGRFGLHGMAAYDKADLETMRKLDVATPSARSDYNLTTWTADASVDYRIQVQGVALAPRIGVTYVRAERDGLVESGANPFALVVAGKTQSGWFADTGVTASAVTTVGGHVLKPYLDLGLRHRLKGDALLVSGRLASAGEGAITVSGLETGQTAARLGAGFSLDLGPRVRASVRYNGDFGDNSWHAVNAGVSFRF